MTIKLESSPRASNLRHNLQLASELQIMVKSVQTERSREAARGSKVGAEMSPPSVDVYDTEVRERFRQRLKAIAG